MLNICKPVLVPLTIYPNGLNRKTGKHYFPKSKEDILLSLEEKQTHAAHTAHSDTTSVPISAVIVRGLNKLEWSRPEAANNLQSNRDVRSTEASNI